MAYQSPISGQWRSDPNDVGDQPTDVGLDPLPPLATYETVAYGLCRWPYRGSLEDCCGRLVRPGNSYCQAHAKRAYVKANQLTDEAVKRRSALAKKHDPKLVVLRNSFDNEDRQCES